MGSAFGKGPISQLARGQGPAVDPHLCDHPSELQGVCSVDGKRGRRRGRASYEIGRGRAWRAGLRVRNARSMCTNWARRVEAVHMARVEQEVIWAGSPLAPYLGRSWTALKPDGVGGVELESTAAAFASSLDELGGACCGSGPQTAFEALRQRRRTSGGRVGMCVLASGQ